MSPRRAPRRRTYGSSSFGEGREGRVRGRGRRGAAERDVPGAARQRPRGPRPRRRQDAALPHPHPARATGCASSCRPTTSTARGSSTGIGELAADRRDPGGARAPPRLARRALARRRRRRRARRRASRSRPSTRWSRARTSASARAAARGRRATARWPARCRTSPRWAPRPARPTSRVVLPPALGEDDVLALHRGRRGARRAERGVTIAGGDLAARAGADGRGDRRRLGRRRERARRPRRRAARATSSA